MFFRDHFFVSVITLLVVEIFVTAYARAPQKFLGGTDASPSLLKHHVAVYRNGSYKFGGSLISERHVLTVAHGFVSHSKRSYTKGVIIFTGMTKHSESGEKHEAKYVRVHPDYVATKNWTVGHNDIAIITLATPAKENEFQARILLPSGSMDFNERFTAIISGWGYIKNNTIPDTLQKSYVTIIPQAECEKCTEILDTHICSLDKNIRIRPGDSGGALVYQNHIVGVISNVVGRCGGIYPTVYTRVSSFMNFINETTKRDVTIES